MPSAADHDDGDDDEIQESGAVAQGFKLPSYPNSYLSLALLRLIYRHID
jgi:hypothetical protein